jgi:signal transduction histidine kinase
MAIPLFLLQTWWKHVCAYAWIVFISFEVGIGLDYILSAKPICPYIVDSYDNFYWYNMYFILGGYCIVLAEIILRIINTDSTKTNKLFLFYVSVNIIAITTISTSLTIFLNWGGLCIDNLGIETPATIWGEWISCVPLIIFCVIALTNETTISKLYIIILCSSVVSLLCGFSIILSKSHILSIILITCSLIFCLPVTLYSLYSKGEEGEEIGNIHKQYKKISKWVSIFFPMYAVIYILGLFKAITQVQTIIMFQYFSLLIKCLFVATIMDIHMNVLIDVDIALLREKEANETRRSFMKYIFHEVRTPLNSINLGIEYLLESNHMRNEALETLQAMQSSAIFMTETLNNVLNFHKIEENKWEVDNVPFNVNEMIKDIQQSYMGVIKSNKILLTVTNISPQQYIIIGDRIKIQHVISNLLSNAIKFTDKKGVINITVNISETEMVVSVRDNGCGISLENQGKLFNNYSQIIPSTFHQLNGSGLGLMFSKNIITLLKGHIYIKSSEVGKGSIFEFTIPIKISKVIIEENKEDTVTLNTIYHNNDKHDIRIMVIDDHEASRKIFTMYLNKIGLQSIGYAENGMQCLEIIKQDLNQYNLLFVDNLMPVMNGVEMTKQLRCLGYNNIIIGLTGNVMEQDIKEFLYAGADYILMKPLKIKELTSLIQFVENSGTLSRTDAITKLLLNDNEFNWINVSPSILKT